MTLISLSPLETRRALLLHCRFLQRRCLRRCLYSFALNLEWFQLLLSHSIRQQLVAHQQLFMGSCSGNLNAINKSPSSSKETRKSMIQGKLKFNLELQNLKLCYPVRSCHLRINLSEQHQYDTPVHIDLEGKHNWNRKISTQIEASELELRDTFMVLTLLEEQKPVAELRVCLYDVINGPARFDFAIGKGRITFDLIMSQIVLIELVPTQIECITDECIQDKAYVYTLRLCAKGLFFSSEYSEKYYNVALMKGHSSSFGNIYESLHKLTWGEDDSPTLKVELPIDEISTSSIQLCIWSLNKLMDEVSPSKSPRSPAKSCQKPSLHQLPQFQDLNLFAEAYIGVSTLTSGAEQPFPMHTVFNHKIEKGLWNKGSKVGNLKANFKMYLPQFLKQSLVGLRTEKGCSLGQSVLQNQSVKEMNDVVQKYEKLCELIFSLQKRSLNLNGKAQILMEAQIVAEQLHIATRKSHKEESGPKQFYYKTYDDLLKGQETFIKLGQYLMTYVDQLGNALKDTCYVILDDVCTRGELRLSQLGYFEECKSLSKRQLNEKNKICLQYQHFLYTTLNQILNNISQKTMSHAEKLFTYKFLVRAYFRVPEFRKHLLQCIIHESDPLLTEWRGTLFSLDENYNCQFGNEAVATLFDWQSYFYNYLSLPNNQQLIQLTTDEEWKRAFAKRTVIFYQFTTEFCLYITQLFQKDFIPWQYIPGYRTILKASLCELKMRAQFSEGFTGTVLALVQNTSLMNAIIMILFNKCQIFNLEQVVNTIDLINQCLKSFQTMPTNFDYPFFLNGIRIILTETDHSYSISVCLNMIYSNFLLFPIEFRKGIVDFIFNNQAYFLFLHWSRTVRAVFQSLLVYRIYHLHRNNKIQITDEEQFDKQYILASRPKRMQSFYENRKEERQLISDYIYLKYTRFIMNLEQAKFKLKEQPTLRDMALVERMRTKLNTVKGNQRITIRDIVLQEENERENGHKDISSEKKIELLPREHEFRNPQLKKTVIINTAQCRYLFVALAEFGELMKVYQKWRQSNIASSQNPGMSPEEKSKKYIEFPVPVIKVMQHLDLKEGRHDS